MHVQAPTQRHVPNHILATTIITTADGISPALPIIRNIYHNCHSLESVITVMQDLYHQPYNQSRRAILSLVRGTCYPSVLMLSRRSSDLTEVRETAWNITIHIPVPSR